MMLGIRQYNIHNRCPEKPSLPCAVCSQIVDFFFKSHSGRFLEKVSLHANPTPLKRNKENIFLMVICFAFEGSVIQEEFVIIKEFGGY